MEWQPGLAAAVGLPPLTAGRAAACEETETEARLALWANLPGAEEEAEAEERGPWQWVQH